MKLGERMKFWMLSAKEVVKQRTNLSCMELISPQKTSSTVFKLKQESIEIGFPRIQKSHPSGTAPTSRLSPKTRTPSSDATSHLPKRYASAIYCYIVSLCFLVAILLKVALIWRLWTACSLAFHLMLASPQRYECDVWPPTLVLLFDRKLFGALRKTERSLTIVGQDIQRYKDVQSDIVQEDPKVLWYCRLVDMSFESFHLSCASAW